MQFSDIRNLVWYLTDDSQGIQTGTGGYFTNTQVNLFINNAQREIQKLLIQAGEMYFLKTVETTTVSGQQDYVLPTDFLKLHRLEYVLSGTTATTEDTQQLQFLTLNQRDLISAKSGTPVCYTIKKDRLALFPIPDTTGKTVRLYYSYRIADLSADADTPDLPVDFHEAIAVWAAESCFIKDDRPSANLLEKKKYYEGLLKQMAEDRRQDSSRMVVVTSDDGYGGMF